MFDHPEGASVKFLVYSQYPAGSPPEDSISISFKLAQLGFKGSCSVRDLWEKKNLGEYSNEVPLYVRKHGAKLLKIHQVH